MAIKTIREEELVRAGADALGSEIVHQFGNFVQRKIAEKREERIKDWRWRQRYRMRWHVPVFG